MNSNTITKRVTAMLLFALLLMTVGFAALQQKLEISGTSSIDSRWDVKIIDITSKNIGTAENAITPTFTNTTATFEVNLNNPNDIMEYDITVKNNGTLDAILSSINKTDSNNPAISFTYSGLETNSILKAGESAILKITVKYNNVELDANNLSSSLTLTLNYKQNNPNSDDYVETTTTGEYVIEKGSSSATSGLVADDIEADNYIFKGADPENYITFNGEEAGWRIISVENDGTIKIIKKTSAGKEAWDTSKTRDAETSTYCVEASNYGCNAWASTKNLGLEENANYAQYDPNGNKNNDTTKYEGTVTVDSSLNTYLNTTYYNELTETAQSQIVNHDFYVSTPGNHNDVNNITIDSQQIKDYVWNGRIALMTAIEYIKASSNDTCSSLSRAFTNSNCGTNNWLKLGNTEWTLSPFVTSSCSGLWFVDSDGSLSTNDAYLSRQIRPVLYLSSDLTLEGNGTIDNPYTIK